MSISEVAVKDAEMLAIKEINAAGGVLGKQLDAHRRGRRVRSPRSSPRRSTSC